MDIVWISLAAAGGAILAGILGFLESGEDWSVKKYIPTILRAGLAAIAGAIVTPVVGELTWVVIISAILAGAGIDVTLHRISGTIANKK